MRVGDACMSRQFLRSIVPRLGRGVCMSRQFFRSIVSRTTVAVKFTYSNCRHACYSVHHDELGVLVGARWKDGRTEHHVSTMVGAGALDAKSPVTLTPFELFHSCSFWRRAQMLTRWRVPWAPTPSCGMMTWTAALSLLADEIESRPRCGR